MHKDEWESKFLKLKTYFSHDRILPFTADELYDGQKRGTHVFGKAHYAGSTSLDKLKNHEGLGVLVTVFDDFTSKFRFGQHSIEEWDRNYVFPRPGDLKKFKQRPAIERFVNQNVLNRAFPNSNRSVTEQWVEKDILGPSKAFDGKKRLNILIGGTGSGKSSFNKYVLCQFLDRFQANKVIASRVEYRKLHEFMKSCKAFEGASIEKKENNIRECFGVWTISALIRDLFFSLYTSYHEHDELETTERYRGAEEHPKIPDTCMFDSKVENKFLVFLVSKGIREGSEKQSAILNDIINTANTYKDKMLYKRDSMFTRICNSSSLRENLSYYLQFVHDEGVGFYSILDGFDYVRASDFMEESTHSLVLNVVANWLINRANRLTDSNGIVDVRCLFQLTVRPCTYGKILSPYSQALNRLETREFYVVPTSFRHLFSSMIDNVSNHLDEDDDNEPLDKLNTPADEPFDKDDLFKMFAEAEQGLARELNISNAEVRDLFLDNIRHRMNYMKDLFDIIASPFIISRGKYSNINKSEFTYQFRRSWSDFCSRQAYRLVAILLCARSDGFVNFVSVSPKIDVWLDKDRPPFTMERIITDQNNSSGFVSNVFDYHIPYNTPKDWHFFLEKLRVLNILLEEQKLTDGALAPEQIIEEFNKRQYPISDYFDVSLAITMREAFIVAEPELQNGYCGYRITPLGKVACDVLITRLPYLATVFSGCRLPSGIVRRVRDLPLRPTNSERVSEEIFRSYLLLRFVRVSSDQYTDDLVKKISVGITGSLVSMRNGLPAEQRGFSNDYFIMALQKIDRFEESIATD